jgi:uncharacterized cupin superfamily protein
MSSPKPPVANLSDVEFKPFPLPAPGSAGERFEARFASVGVQIGSQKLGYNITALPPGKRAFPFHAHRVNEEMFFILEGEGEVRIGEQRHSIKKGDFIACLAGGPETAHQIINTGSKEMRYLAVSTKMTPEIAEYPDSKKFGVLGDSGFRFVSRVDQSLGYWDGE